LVVEGTTEAAEKSEPWQSMDVPTHVRYHMEQGLSKMDAIKQTAKDRGVPKNDVYKLMVNE
jgi:16S rRNA (cytidine1402-2'-O)-methyltransferase